MCASRTRGATYQENSPGRIYICVHDKEGGGGGGNHINLPEKFTRENIYGS